MKLFCDNPRIIFVFFYDVHNENMFTINLEDGREAPSKASIEYSCNKNFFALYKILKAFLRLNHLIPWILFIFETSSGS